MRKGYAAEENAEHGHSVNERAQMKEERSFGDIGTDSPDSVRRGGGDDPRRYCAQIAIDRVVRDHDISGYNHNGVQAPEAANGNNEHMSMMERRAMHMGSQHPDGTYSK